MNTTADENFTFPDLNLDYNNRFISYTGTGPSLMMNGTICNSSNNNNCGGVYNYNDISPYNLYDYLLFVISCLVSLLGTIGNGLVIWFCLFRMEKTVNVIWFLNLAIADFIFALFLAFIIVVVFLHDGPSDFSDMIFSFVMYLNMAVSVLQLAVISVDRCICVVFPVWCHNHRTRRLALIVLLIIWIFSISFNIICFLFLGKLDDYYNWEPIVEFLFFFLLPFIVILSSYTILILRIKDKSIIKSSRPFKIIVAMIIAFFICWFPFFLFGLLDIIPFLQKNINAYEAGTNFSLCLMFFNCCINPILYVFIGQDFNQKCCGSFQAVFQKAFREDMDQMNFRENVQCISSGILPIPTNTSVI